MNSKILIVDDETGVCEDISYFLKVKGYSVVTATNGKEALCKLLVERPTLVLLDIRMPEMDGIECLHIIRELDKEVVVIMVTCVTDIDTANKAIELGATDYITKPISFDALQTAIATYLFLGSAK